MREIKRGMQRWLTVAVLMALTAVSTAWSQEVQTEQAPQPAQTPQTSATMQELLNTAGKTRLSLHGALGFGFDRVDVGTTTSGDTVSISGGGGAGGGVGIAFGLTRSLDLDLDLGFEGGGLTPAVDNAEGSFTRGYFLATLKYKKPTSDTGQFKFGAGLGAYFGGTLKFNRTDMNFHEEVDYDPAVGVHVTGEFERFIKPNVSITIGAKIYFVEYEAKSYTLNSLDVPMSALREEVRNLNGSGMDLLLGINMYFD